MGRFSVGQVGAFLHVQGGSDTPIESFQFDSRVIKQGDFFVAIRGERVDGHDFLEEVAEKGAVGALVQQEYVGDSCGLELIRVGDVRASLQLLAKKALAECSSRVVAITGSVGKTTTKEYIATLLGGRFHLAKTPGSVNSQLGLPLFLLNCSGDEEFLILEMGMSQPGELARLVEIAPPDIAVITRIALAHSEFFTDGLEGIAREKGEIFSCATTQLGVLSTQAASFAGLQEKGGFPKITYSLAAEGEEGDVVLHKTAEGMQVICRGEESSPIFKLPMRASHLNEDFLAACIVGRSLGLSWEEMLCRVKELKSCRHRFELLDLEGVTVLNDSYNANPTSMRAALKNLPVPSAGGKVVAVLGEMGELGVFSERSHLEIGELALSCVHQLLCIGRKCQPMVDLFLSANKPVELFSSLLEMRHRVWEVVVPGDVLLLKGSRSNQLWKVLEKS